MYDRRAAEKAKIEANNFKRSQDKLYKKNQEEKEKENLNSIQTG
jgi:hypothetical protein